MLLAQAQHGRLGTHHCLPESRAFKQTAQQGPLQSLKSLQLWRECLDAWRHCNLVGSWILRCLVVAAIASSCQERVIRRTEQIIILHQKLVIQGALAYSNTMLFPLRLEYVPNHHLESCKLKEHHPCVIRQNTLLGCHLHIGAIAATFRLQRCPLCHL